MIITRPQCAVIYCLVSSTKQVREGNGLSSQETRCREYAGFKKYEIAGVFGDDITGKLMRRSGIESMLAFLRQHRKERPVVLIDDISPSPATDKFITTCATPSPSRAVYWNHPPSASARMPTRSSSKG